MRHPKAPHETICNVCRLLRFFLTCGKLAAPIFGASEQRFSVNASSSGPLWANFGAHLTKLVDNHLATSGPKLADFGSISVSYDQTLTHIEPDSVEFGQMSPNLGKGWPSSSQFRIEIERSWSNLGRTWSQLGPISVELAQIRSTST